MGSHQKRQSSALASDQEGTGTGPSSRPRWRRLRRWLVAVGVAATPRIVSRTPLAGQLLDQALPGTDFRLGCRQVSLAWLSGQSFTGVTLTDSAGESLRIDEPQVRFTGDFHWDRQTGQLASQNLECLTSTLAWRGRNLKLGSNESGQSVMAGEVAFRADIRRLLEALRLPIPSTIGVWSFWSTGCRFARAVRSGWTRPST